MASSTTYGDWMRPIAGGIRNIGKPLTFAGLGVLVWCGKQAQVCRKLLCGHERAALTLVLQKAAGHVQHALAGTEALPKAEDVQPRPAGAHNKTGCSEMHPVLLPGSRIFVLKALI